MNFIHNVPMTPAMCLSKCIKFMYSEKATKFFEISTLLLSYVVPVKSKVEISQNFVAFSEYMNFTDLKPNVSMEFLKQFVKIKSTSSIWIISFCESA